MPVDTRLKIILTIVAAAIIVVFSIDPIAQDPGYHHFADNRAVMNIANFYNVMSNLPFLVFGIMGIKRVVEGRASGGLVELHSVYLTFFVGVLLTGLGSMYYHYQPSNHSLLWDRLPMTISFSAFFSAIVGEYIAPRCAMKLFLPLLGLGVASVVYWHVSELNGNGDLRAYALVQFLPVVLIPLILALYRTPLDGTRYILAIIGVYALSKLMEHFDAQLYNALGFISGHTLKHLVASLGAWIFYRALQERRSLSTTERAG